MSWLANGSHRFVMNYGISWDYFMYVGSVQLGSCSPFSENIKDGWKKAKPGEHAVLDRLLAVLPPPIAIVEDVVGAPRPESEPRFAHYLPRPPGTPSLLPPRFPFSLLRRPRQQQRGPVDARWLTRSERQVLCWLLWWAVEIGRTVPSCACWCSLMRETREAWWLFHWFRIRISKREKGAEALRRGGKHRMLAFLVDRVEGGKRVGSVAKHTCVHIVWEIRAWNRVQLGMERQPHLTYLLSVQLPWVLILSIVCELR